MSSKSMYKYIKDVQRDEYETLGKASVTLFKIIFLQKSYILYQFREN